VSAEEAPWDWVRISYGGLLRIPKGERISKTKTI